MPHRRPGKSVRCLAATRKQLTDLRIDLSDLNITVNGDSAFAESSIQLSGHAN